MTSIVISSALCIMAMASFASAQQQACVHLKAGAGYAAKMRYCIGTGKSATCSDWSGVFAIGKSKCQSLADVPNGTTFSVEVHAQAGKTKTCSPSDLPRNASDQSNIVFIASGTTLSVHCSQPKD
jgi:hypothetical protein